jgi:hypothetical protein
MHPLGRASAAGAVVFVRADVDQAGGMPVIGGVEHDHVALAGVRARQPQRQLVRLAGGVDEEAHAQRRRQQRAEAFGIAHDVVVQIAGVGVEQGQLRLCCPHHARVAVAHMRHVVVHIEKRAAAVIIQVLLPAAHDLERPAVRDAQVAADARLACGQRRFERRRRRRKALGRDAKPYVARAGGRHAGVVAPEVQQVEDDLNVQMRRPVAVHGRRADPPDLLALRHGPAFTQHVEALGAQVAVQRVERKG